MNISILDDLEQSVTELISSAEVELAEKQLQQQREQEVEVAVQEIRDRLTLLLDQVTQTLEKFESNSVTDSLTRKKLEEKQTYLLEQLDNVYLLAAQVVDARLLQEEEQILNRQVSRELEQWRQGLKADLLEMIRDQEDFFDATDAAITVRGYLNELKEMGALEEVVEALVDQINRTSARGPVARIDNSHEQALFFIYTKAMENRSRTGRTNDIKPQTHHRKSEKQPNPYLELEGKVVIYGGHERLEAAVRSKLRGSNVVLVWCNADSGPSLWEQAESHLISADLVFIITTYTSHKLTEKAKLSCSKAGKVPQMLNSGGLTRTLEAISYGLKTQLLTRQVRSKLA
ncbi:DUF2325 domain-containing protein [Leptolyngbya sp. 'hensonii']|uniref:DUF2325 domain-containing protein n=1 Tax=Leptolyngbya sp. 'hensonii' TaxID=1922337 RepID=UPI00094F9E09|nr:DUF2325 domain-containing protein [Leptolyngbya sp. 'hensonii']OLP19776.1 DUF2325 domain-containing protein [Leptolyngbya sp. 'hensonii']